MSGKRAIVWLVLAGALILLTCEPALAEQQQSFVASVQAFLKRFAAAAVGAVFGLFGLLIQLGLRAEWPTGRLNEGSPKVMDPGRFVIAVLMAIAAGIIAHEFFPLIDLPKDREGDAIKNALAIPAFGYLAADLGPDQIKSLWEKIKSLFKSLSNFPKWTRGS